MSSFRNILQRCARNASILGGTPLQIQCASTFNPVYSAYHTSTSRQTYSNDASKSFWGSIFQKYILDKIDAMKSWPNAVLDQKAAPIFNKNLNLRKYYIHVRELSKEATPESLREFYSQFGEIACCNIIFAEESNKFGSVAFTSREAMDRALNALPHSIDGKEIKNVRPGVLGKGQLTLQVTNLSPKTTTESLKAFYSKFGSLNNCCTNKGPKAEIAEVTFAKQKDLHRALDAQPHM
ncbi:RNA recognition motif domain-containing protein [Ditylenchus destructor]|nr:RNA recognition motif domain-containing protein [Ditylenchus destructor]